MSEGFIPIDLHRRTGKELKDHLMKISMEQISELITLRKDAEKLHALHYLLAWNYDFKFATGKAEHGTIQDFWDYVLDDYRNDKIPEPRYLKVHGPESEMSYARLTSLEREHDHGTDTRTANQSVTQPIRHGVDIAVTGRDRSDRVDGEHVADSGQSEQRRAGDRDCG